MKAATRRSLKRVQELADGRVLLVAFPRDGSIVVIVSKEAQSNGAGANDSQDEIQ
jgi:hypothetical protein